MTDIFRQELDIPEKRTAFGWLLFAMGGIMILGAVFVFLQDSKLENMAAQQYNPPRVNTTTAPRSDTTLPGRSLTAREKANRLLFMVTVAFGIVMAFVVVAGIIHRAADRLRAPEPKPPAKPKVPDPWKESANRLQMDPEKNE